MKDKIFWLAITAFVVLAGVFSVSFYEKKQPLVFAESLELVAVTIDEEALTLEDLAYYIAAEELVIEEQANVYDMENRNIYWGLRLGAGKFIKLEAKRIALDSAIHDEIFFRMAKEAGVSLDEKEREIVELKCYDLWSDLTEEQRARLGIGEDALLKSMERVALAEKYQFLYALDHSIVSEDFAVDGEGYEALRKEHTVRENKSVWSRVDFGAIVVERIEYE